MVVRLPGNGPSLSAGANALAAIDTEIVAEIASSIGHAGRRVESLMNRLRQAGEGEERAALVRAGAEAVYAYFVQRELCGFRRHEDVIREYGIPREVLVRLGAK